MTSASPESQPNASQPSGPEDGPFSHVTRDEQGRSTSRMVDVGDKAITERRALARAWVCFPPGVLTQVLQEGGPKGPITEVARVAGILASKRTADLIPMCHPLGLDSVQIRFQEHSGDRLEVLCETAVQAKTGVEMEAMVGASVAALTVYDMCKAVHKGIRIEAVELLEKSGGRSGHWRASDAGGFAAN